MKLRVVTGEKEVFDDVDTYTLTTKELGEPCYYPFLATQEWEQADIDLTEETPRGVVRQLVSSTRVIPHFDKDNITPHVMYLLGEIAADDATQLRSLYLSDTQRFPGFVAELEKRYKWQEG